jgi:putative sigma-54 modulation protein
MKLVIHGKNIEITDAIREYVHQKIEKAVNHFQNLTTEVDVHLSVARNPRINTKQAAEVTIYVSGSVIRAEESSDSLYASIDLVADKIARQLRKYKEKRQDHKTSVQPTSNIVSEMPLVSDLVGDRSPELPSEVVRTKYFAMPPMCQAGRRCVIGVVGLLSWFCRASRECQSAALDEGHENGPPQKVTAL